MLDQGPVGHDMDFNFLRVQKPLENFQESDIVIFTFLKNYFWPLYED